MLFWVHTKAQERTFKYITFMKTQLPIPYQGDIHEVELHYKRPIFNTIVTINSNTDAEKFLRNYIDPKRIDLKEFFWVILLTSANQVIGISEIGSGVTNAVKVSIKEIFQLALKANASAIIVCHNHPSGKLIASKGDQETTRRISKIGSLLNITVLDHIIITSESFLSFSQEQLL